jgi:hypothetical protein
MSFTFGQIICSRLWFRKVCVLIPKFFDFQMIIANKLDRGVVYFFGGLGRTRSRFHDSAIENWAPAPVALGAHFLFWLMARRGLVQSQGEAHFGRWTKATSAQPRPRLSQRGA